MLGWAVARTKQSWQWDYLLAKRLFCNDVLTRCIWWLGSRNRSKPAMLHNASVWETVLAVCPAVSREAAFESCVQSMRCDKMVSRRWPWYIIIWAPQLTLLMLTTSSTRVAVVEWWRLTALDDPSAHDNFPELLQDPINLFISWKLTLGHSKTGSNFSGTNNV